MERGYAVSRRGLIEYIDADTYRMFPRLYDSFALQSETTSECMRALVDYPGLLWPGKVEVVQPSIAEVYMGVWPGRS